MISEDIRVDVGVPHHRKTVKLRALVGQAGFGCLVQLWTWAATARPEGDLVGLPDHILESAAGWDGAPGVFIGAAKKSRFLDGGPSRRRLHNWAIRQPYVAKAGVRSATARLGGEARARAAREAKSDPGGGSSDPSVAVQKNAVGGSVAVQNGSDKTATFTNSAEPPYNNDAVSEKEHPAPVRSGPVRSGPVPELQETPIPPSRRKRRSALSHPAPTYPDGFLRAWKAYPHHPTRSGKQESARVWASLGLESLADRVLAWINAVKASGEWSKDGGRYVNGMQVWLKKPDFADDPPRASAGDFYGYSAKEVSRLLGESYDE